MPKADRKQVRKLASQVSDLTSAHQTQGGYRMQGNIKHQGDDLDFSWFFTEEPHARDNINE